MDTTTAIKAINNKIVSLSTLTNTKQFNVWQKETVLTLINIYSENDKRIKSFEEIQSYINFGLSGIDKFHEASAEADRILKSLIQDISDFGIIKSDSNTKVGGINLNVNQHNHQTQTTNVEVNLNLLVEILKDELKGSQVKELKTIIESNEEPEIRKKNFVEKIKSFGSDVASNILANLLTNPQVYEQLSKLI